MLKFIKKEHYKKEDHRGKIVITYSVSDIVIGTLLVSLVALHIYNNYLASSLNHGLLNFPPAGGGPNSPNR